MDIECVGGLVLLRHNRLFPLILRSLREQDQSALAQSAISDDDKEAGYAFGSTRPVLDLVIMAVSDDRISIARVGT